MPENIRKRNAVRSGPSKWFFFLTMLAFLMSGCANTSKTAGNIATGAGIDAMAGVPYAGAIGLAATAVEIFSKIGKPKIGNRTSKITEIVRSTPRPILDETNSKVITWKPEVYFDKVKNHVVKITLENATQTNLDYKVAYAIATKRFVLGDFGNGGQDTAKKNMDAWKDGKLVEVEYTGPNGVKVVIVSDKNDPGEVMTYEEWMARKNAANTPKIP